MATETETATVTVMEHQEEEEEEEEIQPMIPQSTEKRKREAASAAAASDDCKLHQTSDPCSNPLWKTSLCSYFRSKQGCSHGDSCRYAHGEAELRQRPDNSWDPTSDRAKKLQRTTNGSQSDEDDQAEDAPISDDADGTNLDKCLVGLPRNWGSDNLKKFLDAQASLHLHINVYCSNLF